jgi:hypothetical protein
MPSCRGFRPAALVSLSCLLLSSMACAGTQPLAEITYVIPQGWQNNPVAAHNHVDLSMHNGSVVCHFFVFNKIDSSGNPDTDFKAVWAVLIENMAHEPPTGIYDIKQSSGYPGKYSETPNSRGDARFFLFLLESNGKAVPVISVCPVRGTTEDQFLLTKDFADSLRFGKGAIAQPAKSTILLSELAGEWTTGKTSSLTYADRYTGAYAGTSVIAAGNRYVFSRDGTYVHLLNGINNGQTIHAEDSGTVELSGGKITMTAKRRDVHPTTFYIVSYQAAADGSTVLKVLDSMWAAKGINQSNINFYGEDWVRAADKSK